MVILFSFFIADDDDDKVETLFSLHYFSLLRELHIITTLRAYLLVIIV